MNRQRLLSILFVTTAFACSLLGLLAIRDGVALSAPESKYAAARETQAARKAPADARTLTTQVEELQKQVEELRAASAPRIIAAGTATFVRPETQDNTAKTHVKLNAEIASKLGEDYLVLLTNRYPTGGYPYFSVYWKLAKDGFDIYLVDSTLNWGTTASYTNNNRTYLIDWVVVKK
jgi:hypothetical protein